MRRASALTIAACLIAACSGGGDAEPAPADESPVTTVEVADVVDDTPQNEADGTDTAPVAPQADSTYDQLALLDQDESFSELDHALAELTVFVGPIPGVPTLLDDDSIYPSLTHVLIEIEAARDQLTPEQAAAVDAGVEALFPADELITAFELFPDDTGEAEGFAPQGLVSSAFETPLDEASAELTAAVITAGEAVRSYLGGPSLRVWVETYPLGTFGDVAGRNRGLSPTDPIRDDLPPNTDCIIQLATGATVADIAGIVAHELTHCWQFNRLGFDVLRMNATGRWVIEGQAAYIGQQIGGLTRFNGNWWRHHLEASVDANGQWKMFSGSYDAIGFWSRVAAGSDVVAAMRRTLDVAPSDSQMFAAATSDLGAGVPWIAAGTFQRPEWGGGWTATGPGDPGTPRRLSTHSVIERNDIALAADAGAQANHEINVSPVGGAEGSVVSARGRGAGVLRVEPGDITWLGELDEDWCIGNCVCPDGTPAFPADRIQPAGFLIAAALTGTGSESSTLRVRVDEFDEDEAEQCEEEEDDEEEEAAPTPPPDASGEGLIGTWRADPESVAQMFERASAFGDEEAVFDVLGVTGDVLITFEEGGSGTLAYDSVTLLLDDQAVGDLVLNGFGTFAWSISGPNVVISGTDYAVSVTSSAIGGELLTITDEDIPTTGTTSLSGSVTGARLAFTSADGSQGTVFFPVIWFRQ